MPIADPNRIDIVSTNQEGVTILAMTAAREWDEETLAQLHAKCGAYIGYITSGQFAEDHPESEAAEINLVHQVPLSPEIEDYVARVREWLAQADLDVPTRFSTEHLGMGGSPPLTQ